LRGAQEGIGPGFFWGTRNFGNVALYIYVVKLTTTAVCSSGVTDVGPFLEMGPP